MALLNKELYKLIEGKLHNRKEMQRRVDEWYDEHPADMPLSCRDNAAAGHGTSSRPDPTAIVAIRRANPPREIARDQKWLKVIRLVEDHYRDTPKGLLLAKYYDGSARSKGKMIRACMALSIEQATAYDWREAIVNYTALIAAAAGLLGRHMDF